MAQIELFEKRKLHFFKTNYRRGSAKNVESGIFIKVQNFPK